MLSWIQIFGTLMLILNQRVCLAAPVEIHLGPKSQKIMAGTTLELSCQARGTDPPTIEWFKDGESLTDLSLPVKGSQVKINKEMNELTIKNVSTQDTGTYTCRARDRDGVEVATKQAEVIVEDVPDPPINVELLECDSRIAMIRWTLINENYSPVTQFVIEYNTSFRPNVWRYARSNLSRTTTSHRIALSPWGNYTFRVIAQNGVGWSQPSAPTKRVCHMPPDVPRHNPRRVCTLNVAPNLLVIAWQAMPIEEQNGPGFYYIVTWRQDEDKQSNKFEQIVDASHNQITIAHQPVYTLYEIYVDAVNQMGKASLPPQRFTGYSSEDVPKAKVTDFRLHPEKPVTNTTAYFLWTSVNDAPWRMSGFFRGYKIEFWKTDEGPSLKRKNDIIINEPDSCWRYGIEALNNRQKRSVSLGKEMDSHIYNLWPYTNITVQIRVLNSKYEGPHSKPITFTTMEGVPGPVEHLKVDGKDSSKFMISWSKPSQPNGVITGYTIHYRAIAPEILAMLETKTDAGRTDVTLSRLKSSTRYQVFVWARTKVGLGETMELQDKTLPAEPLMPPSLNISTENKRSVNITWFPSAEGNPGSVFLLEYRKQNTLRWTRRQPRDPAQHWLVVKGLEQAVAYEIRVIAMNGNTAESAQRSSPVHKYILPGIKRHLLQPSFRVDGQHWEKEQLIFVWLDQTDLDGVTTYYVKYRPEGATSWQSLSDHYADKPTIMTTLKKDVQYEVCVVVNLIQSELPVESSVTKYTPGAESGVYMASADTHSLNATCSFTSHMSRIILVSWTIIIIQMQTGYL